MPSKAADLGDQILSYLPNSMQNTHPPDGISIGDLSQVDLGGFQLLMPEQDL
jgi:hypothetical protein